MLRTMHTKTLDSDIYSLSSKRQWTLFGSNRFQEEITEHHTSDIAAYLPFYWIRFIGVYRLCIRKGFKGCVYPISRRRLQQLANTIRQGQKSYWAAFEMDCKIECFLKKSDDAVCFRSRI